MEEWVKPESECLPQKKIRNKLTHSYGENWRRHQELNASIWITYWIRSSKMPQIPSEGPCHQATPLPHPRWRETGSLLTATSEPDILHAYGCQREDAGNNHLVNKGIITNTKWIVTFFLTFHSLEPRLLVSYPQHLKVYNHFFSLIYNPPQKVQWHLEIQQWDSNFLSSS